MAHAELSPSSAERWMTCPGSVAAVRGMPDRDSDASREGTAAHALAEHVLRGGNFVDLLGQHHENGQQYTYDMVQAVSHYTSRVQELVKGTGGVLFVEVELPIGHLTGEEGAHGTSDAVICADRELIVDDLKFGRGIKVEAENNKQAMIYALAALDEFDLGYGPFDTVRIIIDQPRISGPSEWTISVADLRAFGEQVKAKAEATRQPDAPFVASEKGCQWCKLKATCATLRNSVSEAMRRAPVATSDTDTLGDAMQMVPLVEGWAKAVRERVGEELRAGNAVRGFKLVKGKRGHRQWDDEAQALEVLKSIRLKPAQLYDMKLISPTSAEALHAEGAIGPRQWARVLPLITQREGLPVVAPESDKREALALERAASVDDFDDLTQGADAQTATVASVDEFEALA